MSVRYIETDTDRLERDTERLSDCVEKSRKCLTDISDIVVALDGQWDGASNSMFNQTMIEDLNYLGDVLKEASELLECLGYAGKEYVECENSVADIIAAVWI